MLQRYWTKLTERGRKPECVETQAFFVIGDIHGQMTKLASAFQWMDDAYNGVDASEATEVYVGDYIDRGPDSRQVIDALIDRAQHRRCIFLRGNHEDMLCDFLDGAVSLQDWQGLGAGETLRSYAGHEVDADSVTPALVRSLIPEAHLRFFNALPYFYESERLIFVHAGMKPGASLDMQVRRNLLWIREPFLNTRKGFEKLVIHGHTPVSSIEVHQHRINVNTDPCHGGPIGVLLIKPGFELLSPNEFVRINGH